MSLIFLNCCGAKHQLFHEKENKETIKVRENVREHGLLGFLMNPGEPIHVELDKGEYYIPHGF